MGLRSTGLDWTSTQNYQQLSLVLPMVTYWTAIAEPLMCFARVPGQRPRLYPIVPFISQILHIPACVYHGYLLGRLSFTIAF